MNGRYARQEACDCIGQEGQRRIRNATVTVTGVGAIGSAVADLLARAGVGRLRIIDFDHVELDNLQRQCLYDEKDALNGRLKIEAARDRIQSINSEIVCDAIPHRIDSGNVNALIDGSDVLVDAVDCFDTRRIVCRAAVHAGIPWIYGAVAGTICASMTVLPGETACIGCLFPEPTAKQDVETAATSGVLGSIVHMVAAIQVAEVLKLLIGKSDAVRRGLLRADIWESEFEVFPVARREECPICGEQRERNA